MIKEALEYIVGLKTPVITEIDDLGFLGISLCDPGAWISALIPLVPVYIMRMKKITKTYSSAEVE